MDSKSVDVDDDDGHDDQKTSYEKRTKMASAYYCFCVFSLMMAIMKMKVEIQEVHDHNE